MNVYGGWLAATAGLVTLLCLLTAITSLVIRSAAHRKVACGTGLLLCLGLVNVAYLPTIGPTLPASWHFLADARMWTHALSMRLTSLEATQSVFAGVLLVTLYLLLRLIATNVRARQLRKWSEPFPGIDSERVPVRISFEVEGPLTVGALRPVILLPESALAWPQEWIRVVLAHERAHAVSRDGLWNMVAGVATSIFWFNPLVWVLSWRMLMQAEHAADDAALLEGASSKDYASVLLSIAQGELPTQAAQAFAEKKTLKKRFISILYPRHRKPPNPGLQAAAICFSALCGVLLSLAAATDPRTDADVAKLYGATTLAELGGTLLEVRRTTPVGDQTWDRDGNWISGPRMAPMSTSGSPPLTVVVRVPGFAFFTNNREQNRGTVVHTVTQNTVVSQARSQVQQISTTSDGRGSSILRLSVLVAPSARAFTTLDWALLAPNPDVEIKKALPDSQKKGAFVWEEPAFKQDGQKWAVLAHPMDDWSQAVAVEAKHGQLHVPEPVTRWQEGQTLRARPLRPHRLSVYNLPILPARGNIFGVNFW